MNRQVEKDTARSAETARASAPSNAITGHLVDLSAAIERVHADDSWRRGTHAARTLLKNADLRLVLVALPAGGRLAAHQAPGSITIHTLSGELRVGLPEQTVIVPTGHVLAIDAGVVHDVDAAVESAFLLTVAARGDRHAPVEG